MPSAGQVLADRQVEGAAGGQVDHLLEGALAVGAGPDDGRDVVVLHRRGQDLGRRGGVAVDEDDHRVRVDRIADRVVVRSPWVRLSVLTITPCSTKMLAQSTASLSSPPPLPRRSSTTPSAPCAIQPLDLVAKLAVGALAEGAEVDVADLVAVRLDDPPCDRRDPDGGALERDVARLRRPRGSILSSTSVPAGPLIRAVETSEETPLIDLPSTATITSPTCEPGALGRGVGEDPRDAQAPRHLGDGQPDAREPARGRGLERLQLLGGEVVGEPVVIALLERVDHSVDRVLVELLAESVGLK